MKVTNVQKYWLKKQIDVTVESGLRLVYAEMFLDYDPADLYPEIEIWKAVYTVYWLDEETDQEPTEEEIKLIESIVKNYYNDNK